MLNKFKEKLLMSLRLGAGCIIILEAVFRFLIPAAQFPVRHFDRENFLYRYLPAQSGIYTFGKLSEYRKKWRINNYGWNSPIDYREKKQRPRIAVIGDSCVEAFNIDVGESYPYLLKHKFGEKYDLYTFGSGGAPLSEYLNMSRYVEKYFDPDVVIFNIEYNDFDESLLKYNQYFSKMFLTLSENGGQITENRPVLDSSAAEFVPWKRFLRRHSALARYLFFNLELRVLYWELLNKDFPKKAEFDLSKPAQKEEIRLAIKYLVEKINAENMQRKVIFVMTARRNEIDGSGMADPKSLWFYSLMQELCRENSLYCIDLTGPFKEDYAKNQLKFNLGTDEHWNKYGHQLAAEAVYNFLTGNCSL